MDEIRLYKISSEYLKNLSDKKKRSIHAIKRVCFSFLSFSG